MSKKKSDTPVAVRVARWTAITAGITALGTLGNTFIEKRPWFLGGEEDKPAISTNANHKSNNVQYFVSDESSVEEKKQRVELEGQLVKGFMSGGKTKEEAEKLAKQYAEISSQPSMSVAPDMGPWLNFLNFMEYKPVAFWLIVGSISVFGIAVLVEYLIRRKKKREMVMFDSPPPPNI